MGPLGVVHHHSLLAVLINAIVWIVLCLGSYNYYYGLLWKFSRHLVVSDSDKNFFSRVMVAQPVEQNDPFLLKKIHYNSCDKIEFTDCQSQLTILRRISRRTISKCGQNSPMPDTPNGYQFTKARTAKHLPQEVKILSKDSDSTRHPQCRLIVHYFPRSAQWRSKFY